MTSTSVTGGQAAPRPALSARNLTKAFGGILALNGVDLTVNASEIHALLGENGSGKSTLIKILSGYHRPEDGGEVLIDGQQLTFGSPSSTYDLGCRFVHQDLGLISTSSIMDNLYFNAGFPTRLGTIKGKEARKRAANDLEKVGLSIDPRQLVSDLTPSMRTGVAIARALLEDDRSQARLLVLDEPTATLPQDEVEALLEIVRRTAQSGVGVLYVTHRLDEVFEIADNITVLRDGVKVTTTPVSSLDRRQLINLLVGAEFDEIHAESQNLHAEHGSNVLTVQDLVAGPLNRVSFAARPGDVIGFAGITGSGRESILGATFGAAPRDAGAVAIDGVTIAAMRPDVAMGAGMAYLPPDRKISGGFMDFTARENISISNIRQFWKVLAINRKSEDSETVHWFGELGIRPKQAINLPLFGFSGGNQQKVLFGKWLSRGPKVLLLDEPTQGVDVGAKAELHRRLLKVAEDGAAVIISSSDVDELAAVCHRVYVMREGQIAVHLNGSAVTVGNITRECLGAQSEGGA
jgi:ribose transport system ATP-binding protein